MKCESARPLALVIPAVLCLIFASSLSSPAKADTVLTYTGYDFTGTSGSGFNTSMSVDVTLDLSAPLADNMSYTSITPLSWSASDGLFTLNSSAGSIRSLSFSTDSSGNPVDWNIIFYNSSLTNSIQTCNNPDNVTTCAYYNTSSDIGNYQTYTAVGDNFDEPGVWEVTTTPLPAALPLFVTGLGALGLLGWRRKREAQAVAI